jgi:hypothetical protein
MNILPGFDESHTLIIRTLQAIVNPVLWLTSVEYVIERMPVLLSTAHRSRFELRHLSMLYFIPVMQLSNLDKIKSE